MENPKYIQKLVDIGNSPTRDMVSFSRGQIGRHADLLIEMYKALDYYRSGVGGNWQNGLLAREVLYKIENLK